MPERDGLVASIRLKILCGWPSMIACSPALSVLFPPATTGASPGDNRCMWEREEGFFGHAVVVVVVLFVSSIPLMPYATCMLGVHFVYFSLSLALLGAKVRTKQKASSLCVYNLYIERGAQLKQQQQEQLLLPALGRLFAALARLISSSFDDDYLCSGMFVCIFSASVSV